MLIAVLMANPGRADLDPELALSLRNAWGGGELRWLAPGIAAEFPLPGRPDNQWQVWAQLQQAGVDLCLVAAEGRRKAVLVADMDSTMIEQECIDELGAVAGFGAEIAAITARAMNGELDFEEALEARVALMAGLPVEVIAGVLDQRITEMPGGRALVATMRGNGAYAALVSGGFTAFTGPVAARLGFDENRANRLLAEAGRLTGQVGRPILGRQAKVEALLQIVAGRGLDAADVLAVGDGANDLGMLGIAGMGVALHAKPRVQEACELRINHGDLTALLYLQGYAAAEFTPAPPTR